MTETAPTAGRRPHIVLIVADDLGYGDLSCTGSSLVRTPRIDSLARDGALFSNMYAPAPTCTPSRAGLMTGRYAQRVGLPRVIFPEEPLGLSGEETTVAEMLAHAGYRCGIFGKWHLGARADHHPRRHGFDRFVGLPYSNDMHPLRLWVDDQELPEPVDQTMLTRRYTDEAIDFIDAAGDQPFFVYLPHTMPHIPLHVEESFRGTSDAGTYGDTVECIDHHVGRLLDHLEQRGLAEDTVVIFTSDNGPWFEGGTGGLRGRKIDTYEGGIKMPFVARWPGVIEEGRRVEGLGCFIDLLPTFAALAGTTPPADIDGIDISALLTGGTAGQDRSLFFLSNWSLNAVRRGRWKLHLDRFPTKDRRELPQLFDLERDPQECYNLRSLFPDEFDALLERATAFAEEIAAQRPQAEARAGMAPEQIYDPATFGTDAPPRESA
ncbi:sulfatase [Ruania zhangjianzhongii]|uniref:sulfatase family protein n=1 Tax=Ruania zhangjianzhongii TaxID=2603206 RepID=UPI00143DC69B|nr:sulfatase [Ruania zhangjianzhongii]